MKQFVDDKLTVVETSPRDSDVYKKTPLNNSCGIVNLDSSMNAGTHFVCFIILNNRCYYYDSYGQAVPDELMSYFHKLPNYTHVMINSTIHQPIDSKKCAFYCIYMIKKCIEMGFYDAIMSLSDDVYENDKLIYNYFKSKLNI